MSDFSNYLSPGRKGHLVGIGGVSMSSLAEVLQGMGISVTGSDSNESHNVLQLRQKGIKLCVASATAEDLVSLCLTRLGVRDYFEFLLSCESVGTGKNRPDVYFAAAERLGAAVENTVVYEDAWYAVRTAKNAGFRVVAIFDYNSRARWDEIRAMADTPIESWAELLEA